MICAIVRDNLVENIIVIDEKNVPAMAVALKCEIVDARPFGLQVGDLRTERGWTRNDGGEQVVLELLDEEDRSSYAMAMEKVAELEEQLAVSEEAAADEALAILHGEVEEE